MEQKNLYIPGDLVMTNGVPLGTAEGVVYRVTACDPNKTLKLEDGTVLKGTVCLENIESTEFGDKGYLMCECCAWVKDIVPLKLSSEILQKNEWKYTKIASSLYQYYKDDIYIKYDKLEEKFKFDDLYWSAYSFEIPYVHTLQHLLFGLGLKSEMEV